MKAPEGYTYRRKEGRLEWHFMRDCRKYPDTEFVDATPMDIIPQSMVCPFCQRLHAEQSGTFDERSKAAQRLNFLELLFG